MKGSQRFEMPDYVIERVMQKRGRLRVFDRFDAKETALVVIDMQNFYLGGLPGGEGIIPTINKLAAALREKGGLVVWVSMTVGKDGQSLWPLYHEHFFRSESGRAHCDQLTEGAQGHALHADLDARPGDLRVSKTRFSAFLPYSSNLHEQLAARGIRNVAIGGVVTNFCCETSARDAMMMDYRVAMISDACAARYPEDHQAGLTTVFQSFGDVVTGDEFVSDLLR